MDKPQLKTYTALDYHECIHYLEKKYNFDSRDYAGKYSGKNPDESRPYQDFWHWIVEMDPEIRNGCLFDLVYPEDIEELEGWIGSILRLIWDEFGTKDQDTIKFWVAW